jgi:hypothetical protein
MFFTNVLDFLKERITKKYIILVTLIFSGIIIILTGLVLYIVLPRVISKKLKLKKESNCKFSIIPLGVSGGLTEDNLSSLMFSRNSSTSFILFDAGSVFNGIMTFLSKVNKSNLKEIGDCR